MRSMLVAVMLALGLSACSSVECTTGDMTRVPAPDGQHEAVVFGRRCDDNQPSTQVSIIKPGETVGWLRGNIVATDANFGKAAMRPDGGPVVRAEWRDTKTLVLHIAEHTRMFRQREQLGDITIQYEGIPAEGGADVPASTPQSDASQ